MSNSAEITTGSDATSTTTTGDNVKAAAADPKYLEEAKTLATQTLATVDVNQVLRSDRSAAAALGMSSSSHEQSGSAMTTFPWENSATTTDATSTPASTSFETSPPPISWESQQDHNVANQVVAAIASGNENALTQLGPIFDQTMSWPDQQATMDDIANQLNAKGMGMAWTGTDGNLPSLIVMDPSGTQGFELYWGGSVVPRTGADVGLTGSSWPGGLSPLEANGSLNSIDSIAYQGGSADDAVLANQVVNDLVSNNKSAMDDLGAQFNNLSTGDQLATENMINSMLQSQGEGSAFLSPNGELNVVNDSGSGYHLSWNGGSEDITAPASDGSVSVAYAGSGMSGDAMLSAGSW